MTPRFPLAAAGLLLWFHRLPPNRRCGRQPRFAQGGKAKSNLQENLPKTGSRLQIALRQSPRLLTDNQGLGYFFTLD
jgi:hypothetical protein